MTSSSSGAPGLSVPNVTGSVNNTPALGLPGTTSLPNANNTTSTKVTNSSGKFNPPALSYCSSATKSKELLYVEINILNIFSFS